ncbi:response regulator transcription factor [Candidatus Chlorohelix sp.]|uniref:response regulator transcription factor n=1 Tax=Candidatus Chlorohelix sp. TaxID=3139201 RepID=UPI003061C536
MAKTQFDSIYKPKILVVDDEPAITIGLKRQLSSQGYEVRTASGGVQALEEIEQNSPDLVILDLMMPDLDGLQVTREVRRRILSNVPIIVLSARGESRQKVEALDLGADDYLTKPFGLDELLARVRVALRHRQQLSNPMVSASPTIINDDFLTIDLEKHLVYKEGQEIKLTPKQYETLKFLASNPDKLITHQMLLHHIWGPEYGKETQYLHVLIGQLRQKLESDSATPRYILTEPGLGYRFRLPERNDI